MGRRVLVSCVLIASALAQPAQGQDDTFLRGYAAAVLQRDFQIKPDAVTVENGVVTVRADLSESERERLTTALMQIDGVARVVVLAPQEAQPSHWSWLPRRELFRPLIADPRWPRFAAAYQYYIDDSQFTSVAAASFGESFPLLQYDLGLLEYFNGDSPNGQFLDHHIQYVGLGCQLDF